MGFLTLDTWDLSLEALFLWITPLLTARSRAEKALDKFFGVGFLSDFLIAISSARLIFSFRESFLFETLRALFAVFVTGIDWWLVIGVLCAVNGVMSYSLHTIHCSLFTNV